MSATSEESTAEAKSEPQAVIVADRDGVIREWNSVAERIFGYLAVEAIGQTLDLVVPDEERADHWRNYRRVMATNIMNYSPDHILDVEGVRQDGSRVPLDAMLKPICDASGRITAITAIMRDTGRPCRALKSFPHRREQLPSFSKSRTL